MSSPLDFIPTRAAALARLEEFLPDAGRYAADRNFVRPGHPNISRLSPWVQKRLLLEEEVVAAARERWPFEAVEKFVQEVYWRTYWKGWLEQRPEAWSRWVEAVPRLRDALSAEQRSTLEAALAGRTGIAGFDDWAKELVETGYLHNHARMWFASIWVFTLKLPWELGAAFFYEHLLDGDVASNTLSWRWVAGLQTPGKTYVARADNIAHYTDGEHAPQASQLASAAFPITEPALRDLETGVTGFSVGKLRPEVGPSGLKLSTHPTYSHDIPGEFMGQTRYPAPYELSFPDTLRAVRENPAQAPQEFGSLKMVGPRQIIDQQMIDEIKTYEEAMKRLTGKKKGGKVNKKGKVQFLANAQAMREELMSKRK